MPEQARRHLAVLPTPDEAETLIDLIYDAAIDPDRLGTLIDNWEPVMAPLRQAIHDGDLRGLQPFDRHAVRLRRLIDQHSGSATSPALAGIERAAAFVIGPDMVLTTANAAAARVLGAVVGEGLERLNLEPAERDRLRTRIHAIFAGTEDTTAILRGQGPESERGILLALRLLPGSSEPRVLVITSELDWPTDLPDMLREAFGLTPAETDVLRELSRGATLPDIANARGRSVETVRAQLKSIMGKTEIRSQAELVRLTLSMLQMVPVKPNSTPQRFAETDQTVQPRRMRLSDGRRLDYLILGDPGGRPCLFLAPLLGPTRWPAAAESTAARQGLCVIVPLRAGQGETDPPPPYADPVRQFVHDVAALLEHLVREPVPVLTMGDESLIAMALHRAHPRRSGALIACGGTLPLSSPEQFTPMHKWHRAMLGAARYTPHLLPVLLEAAAVRLRRGEGRQILREVYAESSADLALVEDPEIAALLLAPRGGSTVALAQEMTRRSAMDWRPSLASLRDLPVHFLSGLQDPQVPPEILAQFQRDHPWIEFRAYDDAGQLLFLSKWPDALDLLNLYA